MVVFLKLDFRAKDFKIANGRSETRRFGLSSGNTFCYHIVVVLFVPLCIYLVILIMSMLVDVYRNEQKLGRRQLPLVIDENLTVCKKKANSYSHLTYKIS